ncbi:hypothetical protein BX600DRAFT_453121 [Xylariales sp. PMI_506]|nr:hypothetical protein BX600DRAFT_453121 [Xylariales sp. PMI_506]
MRPPKSSSLPETSNALSKAYLRKDSGWTPPSKRSLLRQWIRTGLDTARPYAIHDHEGVQVKTGRLGEVQ